MYYFFEDRSQGHVRIHSARCGHCERGVRIQSRRLTPATHSHWHGPFKTFENAKRRAQRLGLPISGCTACIRWDGGLS